MLDGLGHLVCSFAAIVGLAYVVWAVGPWPSVPTLRIEVMLAVLGLGVLPRLDVTLGGLATADFLVQSVDARNRDALAHRARSAWMRLAGCAVGLAVVVAVGGCGLAAHGNATDQLVAALAGLCLLVRSRIFDQTFVAVALSVAGLAACLSQLFVEPSTSTPRVEPLVAAVTAGAVLAVVHMRRPGRGQAGRRMLHRLEVTAVIATVATTAAASGLFPTA
jgi:hypothetical protein